MMRFGPWGVALALALAAGYTDWRYRRIPNWLTVSGFILGLAANGFGGSGALKSSLLGAGVALLVLLPLVALRGLGAGDWKLMGAVGACVGVKHLLPVLLFTVLVNAAMALIAVIKKGRLLETGRNLVHMVAALFTLHLPGAEVSLDNPESVKIPFGVGAAIAVVVYSVRQIGGW